MKDAHNTHLLLSLLLLALLLLLADAHIVLIRLQRIKEVLVRDYELRKKLLLACLRTVRRVLRLVRLRARPRDRRADDFLRFPALVSEFLYAVVYM